MILKSRERSIGKCLQVTAPSTARSRAIGESAQGVNHDLARIFDGFLGLLSALSMGNAHLLLSDMTEGKVDDTAECVVDVLAGLGRTLAVTGHSGMVGCAATHISHNWLLARKEAEAKRLEGRAEILLEAEQEARAVNEGTVEFVCPLDDEALG